MLLLLFLVGIFVAFMWRAERILTLQSLKDSYQLLSNYKQSNPALFAMLYFIVYVFSTAISVPGAVVLALAGGAMFGLIKGTLLVSFEYSLGALFAFFASRYFLRTFVEERSFEQYQRIRENFIANQSGYLLSLRLAPLFPFFLINLIMGLLPISWRRFYFVSQLGMLPGTLVYVNAGAKLSELQNVDQIMTPSIFISLILVALFPYIMGRILSSATSKR